jgi:hypothetical protein
MAGRRVPKPTHSSGVHFEGNRIDGPVLGQGIQIIQNPGPQASATAPAAPAEQRRAAGRAMWEAVITFLCRGAWTACWFAEYLGTVGFAWSARVTGFADTLTEGWSTVFVWVALAGLCLDLLFFRLRRRWEARGIHWLSDAIPVVAHVGLRLLPVGLLVYILLFVPTTPPIWFSWL